MNATAIMITELSQAQATSLRAELTDPCIIGGLRIAFSTEEERCDRGSDWAQDGRTYYSVSAGDRPYLLAAVHLNAHPNNAYLALSSFAKIDPTRNRLGEACLRRFISAELVSMCQREGISFINAATPDSPKAEALLKRLQAKPPMGIASISGPSQFTWRLHLTKT